MCALRWVRDYTKQAVPRVIPTEPCKRPVLVFTDGAVEVEHGKPVVTVGAVIIVPGFRPRAFGLEVPSHVATSWRSGESYQVVGQAEIFPVLLARTTWPELLRQKFVVYYIDNDSARQALVKGYSPVLASSRIIHEASLADARLGSFSWYARVPTLSNIGDPASRLDMEELERFAPGVIIDKAVVPWTTKTPREL